ncbi:DUF2031 domain-containing protein [Candidatus Nomurabacteria bacterium]|nr:DUF2031 domain-containing protein [Candidatus Nomurabacteria bacterium]
MEQREPKPGVPRKTEEIAEKKYFSVEFIEQRIRQLLNSIEAIKAINNVKVDGEGSKIALLIDFEAKVGKTIKGIVTAGLNNTKDAISVASYNVEGSFLDRNAIKAFLGPKLNSISEMIRSYIEKEERKKVESIQIENGQLKVAFNALEAAVPPFVTEKKTPAREKTAETREETIAQLKEVIARTEKIIKEAEEELREVEKRIASAKEREIAAQITKDPAAGPLSRDQKAKQLEDLDRKVKENYNELKAIYQKIREKEEELQKTSELRLIKFLGLRREIAILKQAKSEKEVERSNLYGRISEIEGTDLFGKV